jgi:hypothetical protein
MQLDVLLHATHKDETVGTIISDDYFVDLQSIID